MIRLRFRNLYNDVSLISQSDFFKTLKAFEERKIGSISAEKEDILFDIKNDDPYLSLELVLDLYVTADSTVYDESTISIYFPDKLRDHSNYVFQHLTEKVYHSAIMLFKEITSCFPIHGDEKPTPLKEIIITIRDEIGHLNIKCSLKKICTFEYLGMSDGVPKYQVLEYVDDRFMNIKHTKENPVE